MEVSLWGGEVKGGEGGLAGIVGVVVGRGGGVEGCEGGEVGFDVETGEIHRRNESRLLWDRGRGLFGLYVKSNLELTSGERGPVIYSFNFLKCGFSNIKSQRYLIKSY